ncbi:acetate--CoA ligase family protein [Brevibacterium atlanticum]|uniref:acetate--CoA ligase family protein n=1 Tax=Brevibacterium atlanticum TaxID=2697563 RepID=UPI00141E1F91|nr:acetate--CoA ligase family protein [Brevibacterium atlanticum]
MFADLELLVRPRSVGVVGASEDRGKGPGRIIPLLEASGFTGSIHPVNPKYTRVNDRPCFPTVGDLPETVDLVVIMVPAEAVVAAVADSAAHGVKFAIIMSSGFSEFGEAGTRMQDEITRIARTSGMRIYGPNCPGLLNFIDGLPISFSPRLNQEAWNPGRVAVITQGGAMGRAVIDSMETHGTPKLNYWFSPGNEADLQAADFLGWLADDEHTDIIVLIMESFRDGRRFMEAARRARAAGKVVALLKIGRSDEGRRAAATHTAAVAGSDRAVDAALGQCGVIRVDDLDELIDVARIIERYGVTSLENIGVCSLSGGSAALLADICGQQGLSLERPTEETVQAMARILPALAAVGNPVDLTTGIFSSPELVEEAMRLFLDDERIDAAIMPFPYHLGAINEVMAEKLVIIAAETTKPIIAVGMSEAVLDSAAARILRAAEIPFIHAPTKTVTAVERCRRLARERARIATEPLPAEAAPTGPSRIGTAPAEPAVQTAAPTGTALFPPAKTGALSEEESEAILSRAGVPFPASRIVDTLDEAEAAASALGYPVVLKAATELIAHKSDAGLVRTDIVDPSSLAAAFAEIRDNHRRATGAEHVPIKVVERLDGGAEVMCGIVMDPAFGPVVSVGLGGIFAELLGDSALRVCPIDEAEAAMMIDETAAGAVLDGARGRPKLAKAALAALVSELSRFAVAEADRLAGIDLNPVLVRDDEAIALDALIIAAEAPTSAPNETAEPTRQTRPSGTQPSGDGAGPIREMSHD